MRAVSGEPRVALVTNLLSHYRVPCFEALAERRRGCIDFFLLTNEMPHRAYVLADKKPAFPVHLLPGRGWARPPFDDLHLNDPRPALRGYDLIVLGGWAEPSYLLLWLLAQVRRTRVAFWIESTRRDAERGSWKESVKRLMLRRAAGAIVPGQNSAEYCEWLGLSLSRIFVAPNAVDTDYFGKQARTWQPVREALRREMDFTGVVCLFVGRMIDSLKGVSVLIKAQQQLEALRLPSELVLIGEGVDRPRYEQMARDLHLTRTRFVDFLDHDALCRYYAAANIFVLPSLSEPWGFVLNEAMEFGLPLVATNAVGAAPDLVVEGRNGFTVPAGDARALASALERLIRDRGLRERMGLNAQERIRAFTPARWADGFSHALDWMLSDSHN